MHARQTTTPRGRISFFSFQDIITSITGILILITLILTLYLETPEETDALRNELNRVLMKLSDVKAEIQDKQDLLSVASNAVPSQLEQEIKTLQGKIEDQRGQSAQLTSRIEELKQRVSELEQSAGVRNLRLKLAGLQERLSSIQKTNSLLTNQIQLLENQMARTREECRRILQGTNSIWIVPEPDAFARDPVFVVVSSNGVVCQRFNRSETRQQAPAEKAAEFFANLLNGLNREKDYLVFYVKPSGILLFRDCRNAARDAGFAVGYDAATEEQELIFDNALSQ